MYLRAYCEEDLSKVMRLFTQTVHRVNRRHYTPKQLDAWAPAHPDERVWQASLTAHDTLVAVIGEELVGFADMDEQGYLDRLYVSADHLGEGIGRALVQTLEAHARQAGVTCFHTEASLTALPFFQRLGYRILSPQYKPLRGEYFLNYRMEKRSNEEEEKADPALNLQIVPEPLAICKLPAGSSPVWPDQGLCFLSRTGAALSLVCRADLAPAHALAVSKGWRAMYLVGQFDFSLTGILAGIAGVLSYAGIAVFALSTYDTDYILLKEERLEQACHALRKAGYQILSQRETMPPPKAAE